MQKFFLKFLGFPICSIIFFSWIAKAGSAQQSTIDWAQPPLSCIEDVLPAEPDRNCLNLNTVADPTKDFPSGIDPAELKYWQTHRQPLLFCRAQEVLRRESAHPGTFSAGKVEVAWMQVGSVKQRSEKISATYRASRLFGVPVHVLTGALMQESMFSDLGIAEDGGNFSCGIGQTNVLEWCRWSNQSGAFGTKMDCSILTPELVRPFYKIAKSRLAGEPEYKINKNHFTGIQFDDVVAEFPQATASIQQSRFDFVKNFIEICSDVSNGISAKAHELGVLFNETVPQGFKGKGKYANGEKFNLQCQDEGEVAHYPLSPAWLFAVGAYNAGPGVIDLISYYYDWKASDLGQEKTFAQIEANDLIASFYWSGVYDGVTDKIKISTLAGQERKWSWFKQCVLQRHIAHVVQNVTDPTAEPIVTSLEGKYKCPKSVFDPATGELVTSAVPKFRQSSTGKYH